MTPRKEFDITVRYDDQEVVLTSFHGEYRNLRDLINDKLFLDNFGECKGMGRCGTCAVQISGAKAVHTLKVRNEESTLLKHGISDPSVRLSCQIALTAEIEGVVFQVISSE